jgi:hypothetical protein
MALSVVVQESVQLTAGFPITLAALRRLGLPTVSVSGSVAAGDLAAGAVTPAAYTPGAYAYAVGNKSGAAGSEVYTLTLDPALAGLAAGVYLEFKADATNTGTGVSLNVNGLGNVAITRHGGVALQPGDIRINNVYGAFHNGTAWQLATLPGQPADYDGGTVTNPVSVNALVLTMTPSTLVLTDFLARKIRFKVIADNTGPVTVQVNALAATALKKHGNLNLGTGDVKSGQFYDALYDGTNFVLLSAGILPQYMDPVTDTGVANAYVIDPPLAGTTYADFLGKRLRWKVVLANTGAATLQIRAIAVPPAIRRGTVALEAGDLRAGEYVETVYDGTYHQLQTPLGKTLVEKYCHANTVVIKTMTNAVPSGTTITVTTHNRATGDKVSVGNSGGALHGGLTAGTRYWIRAIDANTVSFYNSLADAQADTNRINVTNGTGTSGMYYVPLNANSGVDAIIYHGSGTTNNQGDFTVLFTSAFSTVYFAVSATGKCPTAGRGLAVCVDNADTLAADRKRLRCREQANAANSDADPTEMHLRFFEYI